MSWWRRRAVHATAASANHPTGGVAWHAGGGVLTPASCRACCGARCRWLSHATCPCVRPLCRPLPLLLRVVRVDGNDLQSSTLFKQAATHQSRKGGQTREAFLHQCRELGRTLRRACEVAWVRPSVPRKANQCTSQGRVRHPHCISLDESSATGNRVRDRVDLGGLAVRSLQGAQACTGGESTATSTRRAVQSGDVTNRPMCKEGPRKREVSS